MMKCAIYLSSRNVPCGKCVIFVWSVNCCVEPYRPNKEINRVVGILYYIFCSYKTLIKKFKIAPLEDFISAQIFQISMLNQHQTKGNFIPNRSKKNILLMKIRCQKGAQLGPLPLFSSSFTFCPLFVCSALRAE